MFTKKTNKTTKTTTSKKETKKKVEKNQEIENRDNSFKELLNDLSKLKGIRGYIVLVDTQTKDEEGRSTGSGVNAVNGRADVLCNLLGNVNPELMDKFKLWQKLHSEKKDLDVLEGVLKELIRLTKDE